MPVADTQPVYVLTQHAARAPPHVSPHRSHTSCLTGPRSRAARLSWTMDTTRARVSPRLHVDQAHLGCIALPTLITLHCAPPCEA